MTRVTEGIAASTVAPHRHESDDERTSFAFQPVVTLATGEIAAAEALLRWHDDLLGDIRAQDMVSAAERTGRAPHLALDVIRRVLKQAVRWHELPRAVPIAINVSPQVLQRADFAHVIENLLAKLALPPSVLYLETAETLLLRTDDAVRDNIARLAHIGVETGLDHFGGTDLVARNLRDLPISYVKLDPVYARNAGRSSRDDGLARGLVALARNLGCRVVAAGLEQRAQVEFLHAAGCDEGQGFLYGPAVSAFDFEKLLAGPPFPQASALQG